MSISKAQGKTDNVIISRYFCFIFLKMKQLNEKNRGAFVRYPISPLILVINLSRGPFLSEYQRFENGYSGIHAIWEARRRGEEG